MFRALTLAVFLTAATSTQAAVITSGYLNSLEDLSGFGSNQLSQSAILNKFDSSLGTLNKVNITYQLFEETSLVVDNDAPVSTTLDSFFYEFDGSFFLGASGSEVFGGESWTSVVLDADDGDGAGVQNGGSDERDFGTLAHSGSFDIDFFADSDRFLFINSEKVDLFNFFNDDGGTFVTDLCAVTATDPGFFIDEIEVIRTTSAACGATIEYHFTEAQVPEPSVISLFAAGLIGLVGASKRRKAA